MQGAFSAPTGRPNHLSFKCPFRAVFSSSQRRGKAWKRAVASVQPPGQKRSACGPPPSHHSPASHSDRTAAQGAGRTTPCHHKSR
eukprot:7540001-Alexandrium_andersonii.AAC.1